MSNQQFYDAATDPEFFGNGDANPAHKHTLNEKKDLNDLENNGRRSYERKVRICDPIAPVASDDVSDLNIGQLTDMEKENAIKYRTCSWKKTAALLFSEYICLAIMSFPYSYSVLGLVPGLILTVAQAAFVLYTSLVVWEFCLKHPEVRDVCDIGQMLFWNSRTAWYATAVMFILNNTFIQGLHVLTITRYLNTMSNGAVCTVGFAAIGAIVCWACSLPRTFNALSKLAAVSAFFTFVSVLLAAIFAGIEEHPKNYNPDPNHINAAGVKQGGPPVVLVIPAVGTTFVSGLNAFLNSKKSLIIP